MSVDAAPTVVIPTDLWYHKKKPTLLQEEDTTVKRLKWLQLIASIIFLAACVLEILKLVINLPSGIRISTAPLFLVAIILYAVAWIAPRAGKHNGKK